MHTTQPGPQAAHLPSCPAPQCQRSPPRALSVPRLTTTVATGPCPLSILASITTASARRLRLACGEREGGMVVKSKRNIEGGGMVALRSHDLQRLVDTNERHQ